MAPRRSSSTATVEMVAMAMRRSRRRWSAVSRQMKSIVSQIIGVAGLGEVTEDAALAQGDDAAAHSVDDGRVVSGDEHSGALVIGFGEQAHDVGGGLGVEVASGLVCQQEGGTEGEGAGDGEALLLSCGELGGEKVGLLEQAHFCQGLGDAPDRRAVGATGGLEGEGEVLPGGAGEEPELLEDDPDPATQAGDARGGELGHLPSGDQHLAFCGDLVAVEELEQGGFSMSGGSDEEGELAIVNGKVHVGERGGAIGIGDGDVFEFDARGHDRGL